MIEWWDQAMDERLLKAYFDFTSDLVRAGIIDDSLTENIDDDRPYDERIADILRAAGRLPEGWDQAPSHTGSWWSLRRNTSTERGFVQPVSDRPSIDKPAMRSSTSITHGRDWATPIPIVMAA
jgi:hypothetical protein